MYLDTDIICICNIISMHIMARQSTPVSYFLVLAKLFGVQACSPSKSGVFEDPDLNYLPTIVFRNTLETDHKAAQLIRHE